MDKNRCDGTVAAYLVGDWLNYVERKWEEGKYTQTLEESDYSYQTLRTFAWVSLSIDLLRRGNTLSFSHHREVASLEPEKQKYWLARAVNENLSVRGGGYAIK